MFNLISRAYALNLPTLPILESGQLTGPSGIIATVLTWILVLAGAIAVIYLIYGGLLYITAGGDAEKATKGRTALINAIIGIIIIALAIVIVQWVTGIIQGQTV